MELAWNRGIRRPCWQLGGGCLLRGSEGRWRGLGSLVRKFDERVGGRATGEARGYVRMYGMLKVKGLAAGQPGSWVTGMALKIEIEKEMMPCWSPHSYQATWHCWLRTAGPNPKRRST